MAQIKQLIALTKKDKAIRKYTHDAERFNNLSTFRGWQKGKTIYTLEDKKGGLLGLIWFGKKTNPLAPDCPFTFAIRLYPPVRGHGLALKFMREAFDKFKHKGFWLTTRRDNLTAIKLYKNFGFRQTHIIRNKILMVYFG